MAASSDQSAEALTYEPSTVSWAASEFIRSPPASVAVVFVYSLAAFLLGATAYCYFTKIPISISANGSLVTEHAPQPVTASAAGTILKLNVRENDIVKAGQVLMVTDNDIDEATYTALAKTTKTLRRLLKSDRGGTCHAACAEQIRALTLSGFTADLPQPLKASLINIQELLRTFMSAEDDLLGSGRLMAEQRRQIAVTNRQLRTIADKHATDLLATDVEQLKSKVGSLNGEIRDRKHGLELQVQQARDRLEVQVDNLMPSVDKFRTGQAVLASHDGIVVNLAVSGTGQKVTQSQALLSIIPADSELVAEINVANKDIAKVRMGLPVRLKLDALPERQFGAVDGKIDLIPATPSAGSDAGAAAYMVRVHLSSQSLTKSGETHAFRYGMRLSALIVTHRERLLMLGLQKIFNLKESVLGDAT